MYNIAADIGKIEELASELRTKKNELSEKIDEIYKTINDMHESWHGQSYATFSSECYNYAPSLQALVTMVEAFAILFENDVKANAENYIKAVEEAFSNNIG